MARFPIGRFAQEQNDLYGVPCAYCGEVHEDTSHLYPLEGCPTDSEEI